MTFVGVRVCALISRDIGYWGEDFASIPREFHVMYVTVRICITCISRDYAALLLYLDSRPISRDRGERQETRGGEKGKRENKKQKTNGK